MESPHLYDSADYNKKAPLPNLKVKGPIFHDVGGEYNDIHCGLENTEISLDLQNFIDENQHNHFGGVSEHLIQELQGLNVDKNALPGGGNHCPRGIGANTGGMGTVPTPLGGNSVPMYNPLAYLPQPVHSGSQFDRQYHERHPIKEEPQEGAGDPHQEYPACARVSYGSYGGGISPYPMTPTTVTGVDSLLKSPIKSPSGSLKGMKSGKSDKNTDEYRRRRERNNIAVRKSREKAKARSRETEERVKILTDENKKLQEKCKVLVEKVTMYHSVFSTMNLQCLPEPFRSELRNHLEVLNSHQHQSILGL